MLSQAVSAEKQESFVQLLVPIYNEGENARVLYQRLKADAVAFDELKFVYDLDEDITLPIIAELSQDDSRVIAEKNEYGRGVVNALRWGFAHARPGPVIVVMGDNSDRLSIIPEMIEMWNSGAAVVCPSRYMPGGTQEGGGLLKSTLSRLAGKSLKLFGFPTTDPTNNFKLYDGTWLAAQKIESVGGFEVALELVYKAYSAEMKIRELPTSWTDRTAGQSNFRLWKWLPHYLRWYLLSLREIIMQAVR